MLALAQHLEAESAVVVSVVAVKVSASAYYRAAATGLELARSADFVHAFSASALDFASFPVP